MRRTVAVDSLERLVATHAPAAYPTSAAGHSLPTDIPLTTQQPQHLNARRSLQSDYHCARLSQ